MGWAWEAHCSGTLLFAFPPAVQSKEDKERGVEGGGQEGGRESSSLQEGNDFLNMP